MNPRIIQCFSLAMMLLLAQGANVLGLEPGTIELRSGETRIEAINEPIRAVRSDHERVATGGIREGDQSILIQGQAPGVTKLHVTLGSGEERTFEVRVTSLIEDIMTYLQRELRDVVGLDAFRTTPDKQHVVVSGTLRTITDWRGLRNVLDNLPRNMKEHVVDRCVWEPDVPLEDLREEIQGFPGLLDAEIAKESANGRPRVKLMGRAFEKQTSTGAENLLRKTLDHLDLQEVSIQNRIQLEPSEIELEFMFFELSDEIAERVGVDLLNGVGLDLGYQVARARGGDWTGVSSANVNLNEVVEFLVESGGGQIIARQSISVSSGNPVNLEKSGEITVRPEVGETGGVTAPVRVPYGFIIRAQPTLLANRKVELEVPEFSVTEVTSYKSGVEDIEVTGYKGSTKVVVEEGAQRILTRFDRRYTMRSLSGVPLLRHIPLIKAFFSKESNKYMIRRAGFIVVVRARTSDAREIFPPMADDTDEVIAEIQRRLKQPGSL